MKFYESNLFWKVSVPFTGLFLLLMALTYGLSGDSKAVTTILLLQAAFGAVMVLQIWLTYRSVIARPLLALSQSLISQSKQGKLMAFDRSAVSHAEDGQGEMDQLTHAIIQYNDSVKKVTNNLTDNANRIAQTSTELGKLIDTASHNMDKQLQQTDMVATAVTEMSNSVKVVAENAQAASDRSIEAVTSSNNGQRVITETVSAIDRVSAEMNNAKSVVQSLNKDSENIGAVLDVIKGIAEQTNLLALNAAIEAARAGEQGRGFAVVADEVRTLASKTQESTREIEAMIERLQAGASQAVGVIEQGVASTASTVHQAEEARKAITDIVDAVKMAKQMSEHISHAAREQKGVTEEMNRNILTIAGASKDSAQCTKQISENAVRLKGLAEEFRVLTAGLS